jgi:hypothetical protein
MECRSVAADLKCELESRVCRRTNSCETDFAISIAFGDEGWALVCVRSGLGASAPEELVVRLRGCVLKLIVIA